MDSQKEKKAWQGVGHKQRFLNAFRGMRVFWLAANNLFVSASVLAILAVVLGGFYFKISSIEWVMLVFAIGLVIISEVFNTAIEIDIDLTSPEYHPYARDTKDVAAAAVVLSVLVSFIIGLIIFLPKIF
jgi:diacylglycerol kinase